MIKIINISSSTTPPFGVHRYKLMINDTVIMEFDHDRIPNGLGECLRDAAGAYDRMMREKKIKIRKGITLDDCEPKLQDTPASLPDTHVID